MNILFHLNLRIQPVERFMIEDRLEEKMNAKGLGSIIGGGTLQASDGEIQSCDIEIELINEDDYEEVKTMITELPIPKGSYLQKKEDKEPIGTLEGLALYLNGTELPIEVYQECDVNYVIEELERLMAPDGKMLGYYEGNEYTALYFYGKSFQQMNSSCEAFVATYPLCQKSIIKQIA